MPTTTLPNTARNKAGATLLPGAILSAVELLELKNDVHIKWANGINRRGAWRFRDGVHVITLSTYYDSRAITETLWHELTHAVQAERFSTPKEFTTAYMQDRARRGYHNCTFEVEAREIAEAFCDSALAS